MEGGESETNFVSCPVCNREYDKNMIEKHVDKCIFLNTLSNNTKRSASHLEESSIQQKKAKVEKKSPISNIQPSKAKTTQPKKSPVSGPSKGRASFHVSIESRSSILYLINTLLCNLIYDNFFRNYKVIMLNLQI